MNRGYVNLAYSLSLKSFLRTAIWIFGVLLVSLMVGLAVASGQLMLLVVLFGAIFGIALLVLENKLFFKVFVITCFFIIGQLMYFGGINQATWIPYGLGLLFYIKSYEAIILERNAYSGYARPATPLVLSVLLFILTVIFSALINQINVLQFFVGGKNLLFIWGLFFVTAFGLYKVSFIDSLWKKLYLLILFQIPLIAYQFLYVAPLREAKGVVGASWDAVVGGFGGDPMSGGASGTLAFFLVLGFIYFLAMFHQKEISMKKLIVFSLLILALLTLAEVKVIVLLIPVGLSVLYFKQLIRNPFKLVLSVIALIIMLYMVLAAYEYQKRGDLEQALDVSHLMDVSFGANFDSGHISYQTREMGRVAAINHWWQENREGSLLHTLFGYGLGESRSESRFFIGEEAQKYPFHINRSAMTQLLWEVGVVGMLLFAWILIKASLLSYKASRSNCFLPSQKASLQAVSASLAMVFIMLPYGRDVLEIPVLSFYIAFALGYSVYAFKLSAKGFLKIKE